MFFLRSSWQAKGRSLSQPTIPMCCPGAHALQGFPSKHACCYLLSWIPTYSAAQAALAHAIDLACRLWQAHLFPSVLQAVKCLVDTRCMPISKHLTCCPRRMCSWSGCAHLKKNVCCLNVSSQCSSAPLQVQLLQMICPALNKTFTDEHVWPCRC